MRRIIPITAEEMVMKKNLGKNMNIQPLSNIFKEAKICKCCFYIYVIKWHFCSPVVPSSHTVVQPFAVMVEVCDAFVAGAAVFGFRSAVKGDADYSLKQTARQKTCLYQSCVPFTNELRISKFRNMNWGRKQDFSNFRK